VLSWYQLFVPTDKEVVSIQVRTTYLRSYWDFSFLREYNTVHIIMVNILLSSDLKSFLYLGHRHTFKFSYIGWMQTGVSCNNYVTLNILSFQLFISVNDKAVSYCTKDLALL